MVYSSGVFHVLHFEWLKVEHLESNTRYISSCVWLEWHDYYVVSCLGSDCFCRRLSTDVVVDGCQRYEKHFRSSQFYTVQCHKDFFRISTNNLVFILDCTFSLAADCVTTHVIIMLQLSQTLGTFRSEDEDDYEYEFSVLSTRIRFGDRHFSKYACSEQKLVLVVVLVLRSKGLYYYHNNEQS